LGTKVPKTLNNDCSCLQPASAGMGERRHMGTIQKFRLPVIDKCLPVVSTYQRMPTTNDLPGSNASPQRLISPRVNL